MNGIKKLTIFYWISFLVAFTFLLFIKMRLEHNVYSQYVKNFTFVSSMLASATAVIYKILNDIISKTLVGKKINSEKDMSGVIDRFTWRDSDLVYKMYFISAVIFGFSMSLMFAPMMALCLDIFLGYRH